MVLTDAGGVNGIRIPTRGKGVWLCSVASLESTRVSSGGQGFGKTKGQGSSQIVRTNTREGTVARTFFFLFYKGSVDLIYKLYVMRNVFVVCKAWKDRIRESEQGAVRRCSVISGQHKGPYSNQ
jgi:hypothetical protein